MEKKYGGKKVERAGKAFRNIEELLLRIIKNSMRQWKFFPSGALVMMKC